MSHLKFINRRCCWPKHNKSVQFSMNLWCIWIREPQLIYLCRLELSLLIRPNQTYKCKHRKQSVKQGLVKGAKLSFRYPYFYFWLGESTSTASQLTSPASQKSKDLNKVSLLLKVLAFVAFWIGCAHNW